MTTQKSLDLQNVFDSVINLTHNLETYKNHNMAMVSLLKNVRDKLEVIEQVEWKIKDIEDTTENKIIEINTGLEILQNLLNNQQNSDIIEKKLSAHDKRFSSLVKSSQSMETRLSELINLQKTMQQENQNLKHDLLNLSENMVPNIIGNLSDLGQIIAEMRRSILEMNTKLLTSNTITEEINIKGIQVPELMQKFPKQITYKSQEHKETVTRIIKDLIDTFKGTNLVIDEIEGSFIKQMFVNARTLVYEKTEGIAPRFRQSMDNLSSLFDDSAIYPISALTPIVNSLNDLLRVYEEAIIIPKMSDE